MLLTTLHHLAGFEEQCDERRPRGDEFSQITSPVSWGQQRERERAFADRDPQVVIIGAGQGGLMLAARLKQMRVDTLVIERSERVGDVWRRRYNNLTLHNEVFANHFPYFPFPTTWPLWIPKDMMASWLESYAELLELNVWTSTTMTDASYSNADGMWTITLDQVGHPARTIRCPHVVLATGMSGGPPHRPDLPGLSDFSGTVMHSAEFTSGASFSGQRALVIGTGNSGHDIAQDLHVSGAHVTMIQRGPTCVTSLDPAAKIHYAVFDEGRSVDDVDLMAAATPYPEFVDSYKRVTKRMNELDADLLAGLHSVGYRTWNGEDDTGFQFLYLRTGGGYYIDVGCCQLLIDRKIDLVHAEDTDRFVSGGLQMNDGRVLPADLVVLATGFKGMEHTIRVTFGDEIADRMGKVWGFDDDKVMRNMWRRTAQDGLWLMGGALTEARFNSRLLALELCAAVNGLLPPRAAMPLVAR
jgi:cation diffusion facilitator CzcD-associated flavoprotein CzcO